MSEKPCERCGTMFPRNPRYTDSQWARARFCGTKCSTIATARRLPITEADNSRDCVGCGKRLVQRPGEFPSRWLRRSTCNKSCAAVWSHRITPSWRWGDKTLAEAFWSLVAAPLDGCWEWTGSRMKAGYGILWYRGEKYIAHRLSWAINHGPIPDGLGVLHHCDNPPCVHPEHLFLGDNAANMRDKFLKNRQVRGETNAKARLTDHKVREIRAAHPGMSMAVLARLYGVSESAIRNVVRHETWRHVA